MELLNFYLESIFYFLEVPTANDICSPDGNITSLCKSTINFTMTYCLVLSVFLLYFSKKLRSGVKFLTFSVISITSCFYFADSILKKISNPASYGLDGFVTSYYFWLFLITTLLLLGLFYYENRIRFFKLAAIASLIAIIMLSFWGRGTYEQYYVLSGYFGQEYDLFELFKSETFRIILWFFFATTIFGLLLVAYEWIVSGNLVPNLFFRGYKVFLVMSLMLTFSLLSLPIGDFLNEKDVQKAKDFINDIKKDVDKFYLENGEYPKFISDFINEEKENPFLLKRHEYFTLGVRGTYYFSRADKYCFIFQNPSADFGYYSITSNREWRQYSDNKDFGNVYLSMCDESLENEETLFSDHFGMPYADDELTKIYYEFNSPDNIPHSKESTRIIHEKIMKYGKEVDPKIFDYYKDNISGQE